MMTSDSSKLKKVIWLLALLLLGLFAKIFAPPLYRNIASLALNQALGNPTTSYTSRMADLAIAANWGYADDTIVEKVEREQTEMTLAYNYLQKTAEFAHYTLGPQLLSNPSFINGAHGWIQYNSSWSDKYKTTTGANLSYSRQGPGHGSLSQTLNLSPDTCYLFALLGSVTRTDEIPTFWFYWETYEQNEPIGHHVLSAMGDQPWERRFGVFCLPAGEEATRKVTITPINLYGDATVYLDNARLYHLITP